MKPQVVFIGSVYPEKLRLELLDAKTDLSNAAHVFQSSLIYGLLSVCDLRVITSPKIWLPKVQRKSIAGYKFEIEESKAEHIYIGYNKHASKLYEFLQILKELKYLLKTNPSTQVIIYSLHSPFLLASLFCPNHRTSVIVPDLPEYMSGNKSTIYRVLKKIDRKIIDFCLKKVDSFILFSPHMKEKLTIEGKPWMHMEGIYREYSYPAELIGKEDKFTLLYTGGISARYGVFDLIEAFTRIDGANFQLWLCGDCNDHVLLQTYLKKDTRIKYYGCVDMKYARILQKKATLLVNPRKSTEIFTKYSFPSKTLEYMASGTPTLMCRLPATPKEYYDYLYFFEEESIDGYKKKIVEISFMEKDVLREKGRLASAYIKENKNAQSQAKKMLEFIINN